MKVEMNQKVGFEGTLRLDPYWKLQPATCKVNMEWKSCEQRQFSLMGQNFSWLEQVGHRLEQQGVRQQRAGNLCDEVRGICVEDECTCSCEPIKG